ncbi:unnamed protein product [Brassica oleracea var. botrytis]
MTDGDETQIRVSQLPLKSPSQLITAAVSSSSSSSPKFVTCLLLLGCSCSRA